MKKDLAMKRQKTFIDAGFGADDEDIAKEFEQHADSIQLINISEDQSQNHCLIYYFPTGDSSIGTDAKCTIQMNGLGMIPQQAKFKIPKDYATIHIEPTAPDNGKVTVNGNVIKEKLELKHKDTVVFGVKNMFKVIIPKQKTPEDEKTSDVTDYDTILQHRLNNNSPEAACMRKYLEETRERIGEVKSSAFVRIFEKALLRLDEANEYTRARYVAFPLNRNYVYFSIEIMIDVLNYDSDEPEIAIRC